MHIEVATAGDYASAIKALGHERFDLVLTDMRLPDGDGLGIVEWIQHHRPGVPVAVITAHGNVEAAVRALKLGAFDFISKPLDLGVAAQADHLDAQDARGRWHGLRRHAARGAIPACDCWGNRSRCSSCGR